MQQILLCLILDSESLFIGVSCSLAGFYNAGRKRAVINTNAAWGEIPTICVNKSTYVYPTSRGLNLSTNSGGGEQIKGHISSHPQSQNDIYFPRDGMLSTDTSSIKSQCNTY